MEFITHCSEYIIIEKMNCGIFRHGVFIKTGKQIDPHANKTVCDNYIKKRKYMDVENHIKL